MLNYVYMKLLESRPRRYDRGLAWLSLGQATRIKRRIVQEHVLSDAKVLEIGVGTGQLAVMAAEQGAMVTGFDISEGMLAVARRKVADAGLQDRVCLAETGVGGMDDLPEEHFDLVVATLVFSELSSDEQCYAMRHAWRTLRSGGKLVLADEVRPERPTYRLLHALVRLPVALVTYIVTQTTTRAVCGIEQRAADAGFVIEQAERSTLGSFLYLVARKVSNQ